MITIKIFLALSQMGTGQNCTKTKLHEGTNLHEGLILHEDTFAPRVNFARVTVLHESKK